MDLLDDHHIRVIEALLFAAEEPVQVVALHERLGDGIDVENLLQELQKRYAGRGIEVVEVAGGWMFRTAPDLARALKTERHVERKLSKAGLETLSVIAYHQPVTRAEIENIRGVATGKGTIDTLLETGWIRPAGRREAVGRPLLWATTDTFLMHFGLAKLSDLPGLEDLKASGLLDTRPATAILPGLEPAEGGSDVINSGDEESEQQKTGVTPLSD